MDLQQHDIRIRNAEASDAARLAAWWNDGSVMAHAGFPLGLGVTAEEIAAQLADDSDSTYRRLILEYRQIPIGEMSFRCKEKGVAEIGVKICEESYQNRGIGRKALSLLIRGLFDLGCGKIVLDTNLNNLRAQHVYETLGFQRVCVHRDAWRDQLGRLQSSVDYELTRDRFVDDSMEKRSRSEPGID